MTRFWITLDQSIDLVIHVLENMSGGEIYVPKLAKMSITELARAMGPDCLVEEVGIRPGEKIHKALLNEDESARALGTGKYYEVPPQFKTWNNGNKTDEKRRLARGFVYTSENAEDNLNAEQLTEIVSSLTK